MADSPTVVRVHDVSKRFVIRKDKSLKERLVNAGRSRRHREDFWALRNVDLEISAGTTVGLIGPNGSGKSTLLKTIGGILQPTSGTVERRGRLAALLELGAGFHPDLTGRENVYLNASILGLSQRQTDEYFDAIVDFSGIERFIDTQVKFYSSGMYVRLAFAVAVHVDPDVLLVDEVLAVGDEPFQRKCLDQIRSFQKEGRTIILVTHALDQVVDLCDRAVVLENGRVVVDGDPALAARTLRADFEVVRQAEQRTELAHEPQHHATVTAVRLIGDDGSPITQIAPGDDLRVQVDVEAASTLDDWVLGVGIDTPSGQSLYGTNTQLMGTRMPPLTGRGTFEVQLRNVWLGGGQYEVHGALAVWAGPEIHRLPQAASFSVTTDGRSVGFLGAEPSLASS
ncbi:MULTISPECIES: ABC transporter ATP-binding protein [unclassified Modestobacter]|uniref:ABC transporter ATP-binding protein n=1 Tax=unclassified Modestobacter TaxID=2643866 RepID=UPI0022AA73D2|nr:MULTISPECIES: ABC transporter ATP-binding protein [unclassified Modestobacter]MCZ2823771.1 ABC transporter ATP-binding protein [Modestobacter sp. VKM Ac-2981]MCZ2852016.1 ABC transporter ATP-binding protein [Modestobacter sp. VKM Ac-2982]